MNTTAFSTLSNLGERFAETLRRSALLWERPRSAGIISALIFLGLSCLGGPPWRLSHTPYFNYLADALLHGQLALRQVPPNTLDLSLYQGQYYLYWGPLPALLAMPLVALFGIQASDILQSITVGAVNAALFALLLRVLVRRGWVEISPLRRGLLVLFFTLGTNQATLPAVGEVWFLLQLESITAVLLAALAAFSFENEKAFFWTGCAVAAIVLSRMSAVFAALFLAWHLLRRHWGLPWRRLLRMCALGLLPVIAAGGLLLAYNYLRFGNPLDNGLNYHLYGEQFVESYQRYGVLSLHYIPINLYLNYVYHPLLSMTERGVGAVGGSLFLFSPVFFAGLWQLWQGRASADTWVLLAAVLLGNIPALIVMAPGSMMIGPRYLLDIMLPLMLLTLRGLKGWPTWLLTLLVLVSILQYLIGALMVVYVHIW